MKAWLVTLNDCDSVYVLAESAGKATAEAMREASGWTLADEWSEANWKGVRRRRVPELDGDGLTIEQLIRAGKAWGVCPKCGGQVHGAEYESNTGALYCTPECLAEMPRDIPSAIPGRPTQAIFLSTEY